jgi:hypothetical protein
MNLIKNNIIVIIVYLLLETPLLFIIPISYFYFELEGVIFYGVLYQVYLGALMFILYTMKENIERKIKS